MSSLRDGSQWHTCAIIRAIRTSGHDRTAWEQIGIEGWSCHWRQLQPKGRGRLCPNRDNRQRVLVALRWYHVPEAIEVCQLSKHSDGQKRFQLARDVDG